MVGFNSEEHSTLSTNTAYDLLGRDRLPLPNPPVIEGRLHSVDLKLGYNMNESNTLGVTGLKRIQFAIEHADDRLGGDFNFTRYTASVDWNFPTFYKRRFLPNTLDLRATAGTFSGSLPPQRYGIVDGSPGIFGFFGGLRSLRWRPYEGEQYASLVMEHNFRTVPFELLGLRPLVERELGLILFAGAGKTWVSEERREFLQTQYGFGPNISDGVHTEVGVSLNKVLGLFRIDFATRLDEPAFLVNIGVARLF